MSRQWLMDFDRPLSDEDKEFLRSRGGHQHLIDNNEERFGGDSPEDDPGPNLLDQIKDLDEKQLNAALKERKLSTAGKLQDRRDRLAEYVLENEADDDGDDDEDDNDEGDNN